MKYYITTISLFLAMTTSMFGSTLTVSTDIGFDPDNSTNYLQFALEGTAVDTIVIDNTGLPWKTGPLRVERDNITIIMEEGVLIEALPGAFGIYEPLFWIRDKENIKIWGYGATLKMQRQEYVDAADSEFRHGISLLSAKDIWVEGLNIIETGGDGIFISKSFHPDSEQNYCENVTILNCRMSNNYRQGMSITSAKNLNVLYSEFSETSGTLPEDGIDIEPDEPTEILENIFIKGCKIFNNNGRAIQLALVNLDDNSQDISITIEETYMSNNYDPSNEYAYAEIMASDNGGNGVDGFVKFSRCLIENSQWTAVYALKGVDSYLLEFESCVFKDISNDTIAYNNPIFFDATDYNPDNNNPRFGGAIFTDCTIIYDKAIPFFATFENDENADGLSDISGNFFIISPSDIGFDLGTNLENMDITYSYFSEAPYTEIGLSTDLSVVYEGEGIDLTINRATNTPIPLAVRFGFAGDALHRIDYDQHPGFVIFENNENIIEVIIPTVIDEVLEGEESCIITALPSDWVAG